MTTDLPSAPVPLRTVRVGALEILACTETEVVRLVERGWTERRGGWLVTANVDIARAVAHDPELRALVGEADHVVADGMPIVWASRISGTPLPERVTGSSLVFSLGAAAARADKSIFLLGGEAGVPEKAARTLVVRYPALKVAGTFSPPLGFDTHHDGLAEVVARVRAAEPDLVLAGLGFPKQERTIRHLRDVLPQAWYVGCGAGIPMAAGEFRRAPAAMQRMGAEWLHRLALEPRRLARRYLHDDGPFALRLLTGALLRSAADRIDSISLARDENPLPRPRDAR